MAFQQTLRKDDPEAEFPASLSDDWHRDHIEALQRRLAEETLGEDAKRRRGIIGRLLRRFG